MTSCHTVAEVKVTPVVIPLPLPPEKPNITFEQEGDRLWITIDEGRALAIYLKQMERYQTELNRVIEYYVVVNDVE